MSAWDAVAKVASKVASKGAHGVDEAMKVLAKYDTVEAATALKGPERQAYLDALDTVYGDRAKRAKDLGFGKQTWYHGTGSDIKEFDPTLLKTNATGPTSSLGFHFAKDPKLASQYAEHVTPEWYKRAYAESNKNFKAVDDYTQSLKKKYGTSWTEAQELATPEELAHRKQLIEKAGEFNKGPLTEVENRLNSLPEGFQTESGNNIIPVHLKTKSMVAHELDGSDVGYDAADFAKMMKDEGKHNGVVFKNGYDNLSSAAMTGSPNLVRSTDIALEFDPKNIRSTNAAFDPRFKDSANILAGAAAIPSAQIGLGSGLSTFADEVAKPLYSAWEGLKHKLYEPLSKQLNLTKDPEQAKQLEEYLSMAGDPANLVGGPAALGVGALQLLGSPWQQMGK